jgi:fluoroquinolone resistance protein
MEFTFDAQQEYSDQTFRRVNYAGKQVNRRIFDQCVFANCTFAEAVFANCKFRDCTFRECDLRLAQVPGATFTNTGFERSKVTGVNWTTSAWPKGGLFTPVHFTDCDIGLSVFFGLDLRKIQIVRCSAKGADFAEADLTQANCTGTDFTESRFLHTDLTEADFTGATNYSIAASMNTLKKTKFALPEVIGLLYGLDIIIVNADGG